ncbi:hypothetical protein FGO68_gene10796 [Halteria grandinella]|uniref:protein-tyrosine-phosphatase n=1 Tax=Halteria grandinella TaxID=5974 RepID=A0A8J8NJ45_HALGN|nr:hypothetical protein FGO68_gene10796 [Halteria grandinella]
MVDLTGDANAWFDLYKAQEIGKLANYNQITDKLYLSGYQASEHEELVKNVMKVGAILTVANDLEQKFAGGTIEYKQVDIIDSEEHDVKQHFKDCIAFIRRVTEVEGKNILVHCAAGVSRSASVVVAYIMVSRKLRLKEAFAFVLEKRPCIKPNEGFMRQLEEFEKELISQGLI